MTTRISAEAILRQKIIPITVAPASFSQGKANEFYSEADYWWPSSDDSEGDYVQRDGLSNPACYNLHRKLLIRMSVQVARLTLAYRHSGDARFLGACSAILQAWFIHPETAMRPHLNFAQSIRNRCPGRSYGIIDSIHLAETALSVRLLGGELPMQVRNGVRHWFQEYLCWLLESTHGQLERSTENNHAVCWYMQAAAFALLTEDRKLLSELKQDFTDILLQQMAPNGSFPRELQRSKPYSYSLFILESFSGLATLLSEESENFFLQTGSGERCLADGIAFMYPYIKDKTAWPRPGDVQYDSCWPVRQSFLWLAAHFTQNPDYLALWSKLPIPSSCFEVIRNFPVRFPQLWLDCSTKHQQDIPHDYSNLLIKEGC